jgi:pyruvate/2-oxoglutarate dehydrogenase complex dihydrolipoamide dehydrogenase (E3) component
MTLALYGHPFSSYTWKALIVLYAADTPFAFKMIDADHPETVAVVESAGPLGRFPVLADGERRRVSDRTPCDALYIDPPLGRVGMTETQARATGRKLLGAKRPMTRVGRAVEKGETQSFMKVTVDAETHKILGAAILGTGGDEAIHGILDIAAAGEPYTTLKRTMPIQPTVSELIPTVLGDLKPLA